MTVKNKVQLITYPDSMGGNLKGLRDVLKNLFPGVFKGGIHILPPFPSSGDRGFAPIDYLQISPEFGSWEDIQELSSEYDILLDLMVNHISKSSKYFQDFLKKGRKSEYSDIFITLDKLWKDGIPLQEDIDMMFLRRKLPYSEFIIEDTGERERVWTTFGKSDPSEQIDIDVRKEVTKKLIEGFLENFSEKGVKLVRLDAVGYVIKKLGTSCFFAEPEIYDFLDWIKSAADSYDLTLLPEVHSHYDIQYGLSEHGFWIYDFILPYMILDALINRKSEALKKYIGERPHRQFTMLDCHDGVPVMPDLEGIINTEDASRLVDEFIKRGANLSLIVSEKHKSKDGFDVHQIRGTYYSLLDCNDDAYIAARALQFFVPGIPQVYYTGLLAGKNDLEAVKISKDGREINRHNYTKEEIESEMKREVVKRLVGLIGFRNEYEAFNGHFTAEDSAENSIRLKWEKNEYFCRLTVNLNDYSAMVEYKNKSGTIEVFKA